MNIPQSVEQRFSKRYENIRKIVNSGKTSVRPSGEADYIDISTDGTAQWGKMQNILDYFIANEANVASTCGDDAVATIMSWCECDRSAESINPVKTDFFPTIIRGVTLGKGSGSNPGLRVEDDFPILERPAVLTRAGLDKLQLAAMNGEIPMEPKELDSAFIGNIGEPSITVPGETINLLGQELNVTPNDLRSDSILLESYHVSYTESWQQRWSEARRYTPFYLTSNYLSWIMILVEMGLSWDDCIKRGVDSLYTGVLYLACEWVATNCHNVERGSVAVAGMDIVKAWRSGNTGFRIPQWIHKWRAPMSYKYVTASDVGYKIGNRDVGIMAWSRALLSKKVGTDQVEETPMPFVEKTGVGYPLQSSALTTMGPLRFYLCFSLCIESCCSNHLVGFHTYYQNVLSFLGCNPGRVGRKLAKTVVKFSRLVASDLRMVVPNAGPPKMSSGFDQPYDPMVEILRINDVIARQAISQNFFGVERRDATKRELLEAIIGEIPQIGPGLTEIFNEYCVNMDTGSEAVPPRHTVSNFNKSILDVITHTASAGSVEGYSRSCLGSLTVTGYTSKTQRLTVEGIDSDKPRAVDTLEYNKYQQILSLASVPTLEELYREAKDIAIAKSAAGDKAKFDITEGDAIGSSSSGRTEKAIASRKDVLFLIADIMIRKELMLLQSSEVRPFLTGLRSVPARKLRYIYMLPMHHQMLLQRMYTAFKEYQKEAYGYALAQKKGIIMYDVRLELCGSIDLARNDRSYCVPADASSLDQHMGIGHREVLIKAIEDCTLLDETTSGPYASELYTKFGYTYKQAIINALRNWNESYYRSPVPGAPDQVIHVDTQPSGALTTAVLNSHITDCMMALVQERLGFEFLQHQLWGDDFYGITMMEEGVHPLDKIQQMDDVCLEAGQKMGTVADSTLGRGIHFLQKHYIGGQIISRRVAYDHEKEVAGRILCGDVASYLTKAKLLASRGGNLDGLNMLQLLTVINGSRSTQFGRQAKVSFDSMSAPGGLTNQVILGFANENSRLFLELNAVTLFKDSQVTISKRPSIEVPITTGRRVLSKHMDTLAKVNVGGTEGQYVVSDLLKSSELRLLDPSRLMNRTVHSNVTAYYSPEYIKEVSYSSSVHGSASKAIGESLQTRSLRPKFIERALMDVGLIGESLTATAEPDETLSSTHTGFKYNDKLIIFGYSNFYMKLPQSIEKGEDMFVVYDQAGNVVNGMSFSQIWHPFYSLPLNYRLMCSLFGMTTAPSSAYDVKAFSGIFSPDRFRKDVTKEEVISIVKKLRHDQAARHEMLSVIGFNSLEIGEMESQILNIESFEDVEEASEYSSIPEVMKCLSTHRINILMLNLFPNFFSGYFASAPPSLKTLIYSHFLALIADEMNVSVSLGGTPLSTDKFIRLPTVEIIEQ